MEVSGSEWLDASATTQFATISLAEHSRLVVTGSLRFIFGEEIIGVIGDASATLVNYGTIATERGFISVPVTGHGALGFSGAHDQLGVSRIAAPIGDGQTVQLDPRSFGMRLELTDAAHFHGTLDVVPNPLASGDVLVAIQGVQADSFAIWGHWLLLANGSQITDMMHLSNPGAAPVTMRSGTDATTLTYHTAHT